MTSDPRPLVEIVCDICERLNHPQAQQIGYYDLISECRALRDRLAAEKPVPLHVARPRRVLHLR